MSKIIIKNQTKMLSDYEVLSLVQTVVAARKRFTGAKGKQHYAWLTIFNQITWKSDIAISVTPKYKTDSDIFTVWDKKRETNNKS